ncbi:MAG: precorrin-2 dehydrogenase [Methanosaeta sp. PtaU1.Bin060]|nr:MAG: precorrin-2 dehydrogenase [Methanosaeta sp. PtaU1.Bin060]
MTEHEEDAKGRLSLPLQLDLSERLVVIFGGGGVGERKARLFSRSARVIVISSDFTPGLRQMEGDVTLICAKLSLSQDFERYLEGAFIVIPATSDRALNRKIEQAAQAHGVLVNRVDGVGDVVVPSLVRKGPITIAIFTKSPALSKHLRLRLEEVLSEDYEAMARLLSEVRKELKGSVSDQRERARRVWRILEDEEVWRLLDTSYEKAYNRARELVCKDERDSLDACDPPQGIHRRD